MDPSADMFQASVSKLHLWLSSHMHCQVACYDGTMAFIKLAIG